MFGGVWEREFDAFVSQELSHGMMFEGGFPNELFGLLCNVPQGIPSFIMFKKCATFTDAACVYSLALSSYPASALRC